MRANEFTFGQQTSVPLSFRTVELKESEITAYVKKYFESHSIDLPHGKFISNIKRLSKINESVENVQIKPFINMVQSLDSPRTIKVGDKFSVLEFEIIFAYKEINGRGFIDSKEVASIKLHPNGKINYVEFTDGDRYPRLTPVVYQDKPITYAAYFTNEKNAHKALTAITLAVPDGWDLDISDIRQDVAESDAGIIPTGYAWSFEPGSEVPYKSDVEVNTFIRVRDSKGKTVLGVWADVYRDDVEIQYSEVFDKKLRGKGIYTDFLKALSKHYNIISDQDHNNAAREIYKKLGADYNPRSEKHTLRRSSQDVAEGSLNEFAPASGGGDDILKTLAAQWLHGDIASGDLSSDIQSQEQVERRLEKGIVCPDGVKRKLYIDYNRDYDGVVIYGDDDWSIEYKQDDLTESNQGVAEDKPDKKTIKSLEKHYSGYKQEEEDELQDYTGGDYGKKSASRFINKPLGKEKGVVPPTIAGTVAKLDAATTRHVTPRELTVYYGTGPKRSPDIYKYGASVIKNIKPKSVPPFEMINHAYTSTTLDSSIADNFSVTQKVDAANYQEHTLTIKVPKGFRGAYVGHLSAMLDKYHGDWDELEFILPRGTRFTILPNPTIKKHTNPREPGLTLWQFNWQVVVVNTAQQGVAEDTSTKKISFKLTKGKNKFSTTMLVDGVEAGIYQYDANSARSIAEVYPEFKGQGFGKILFLNAIYTAAKLGMDFLEDESRTAEADHVLDSLSDNGYIINDDGYLYVTGAGEKYLKQSLRLDEMALSTYKTMGDFDKPGPFIGPDKKLVPHQKNIEKATQFFEQTPYDFRLFFSNIPGTGKYSEHGPMTPDEIRKIFGKDAEEIINGSSDAITVVYVGNKGDRKVMLTPWMMAHRFGHAIQSGARKDKWSAWTETEKHFFNSINNTLEEYYGKAYRGANTYRTPIKWDMTPEYNALFNAIGTQRSSRSGEIRRPYEFLYELFAQYLGTGKVTFNPLPANLTYGRKVWGNPTKYMNIKPELRDEATRKEVADQLAYDMELMFNDVLAASVGKIFVM